jgi:hypothetical protein
MYGSLTTASLSLHELPFDLAAGGGLGLEATSEQGLVAKNGAI